MAGTKLVMAPKFDVNDPKTLQQLQFKKAANVLTARSTRTKAAARRSLVSEGILTKSGKISKKYR